MSESNRLSESNGDKWLFSFPKATPHAFLFENAHLLLICFDRDEAKFLFLIRDQRAGELVLDYPGRAFTERVLDTIEPIFFIQVSMDDQAQAHRYALGSYFLVGNRRYGAYYRRDAEQPDVVLFRIDGEPPDVVLTVPDDEEYRDAARAFAEQHADVVRVERVNFAPGPVDPEA
ncbi:MAG: hypothetical protein K6T30_05575 [Alicyclobacillus sp.]|nr:hypothetical protein [Alicyclobacillus sp.]